MPVLLTKSDLLSAVQCSRKVWLEKRQPTLAGDKDPASDRRKMEGLQVGEISRKACGPDVLWPNARDTKELTALAAKEQLAAAPDKIAVEVPMFFDNVYVRADAMLPAGEGHYVLRETKATTFPLKKDKETPDKPEPEHVIDLGIQAWVAENSGIPMARAELNLLNNKWRYPGGGDYSGMFRQMDVTEEVHEAMAHIPILVAETRKIVEGDMPDKVTGRQCSTPYTCQYQSFCKQFDPPKPEHPIELLPDSAGKKLAAKLKAAKGYVSIDEPNPNELTGAAQVLYRRIQLAHVTGESFLDPNSGAALADLPYPRYYFDFEGIDLAVPVWEGVRPYEQIPYQWSCHIERMPGMFEHTEFLDLTGKDPSLPCIEEMLKSIDPDDGGPIFVYFATYERSRLQDLAIRHPEHEEVLNKYISRLVDLLPEVKENYYHPKMRGSFSIKKVLPVVAPDLDYGELDEVNDGVAAQLAYIKAALTNSQAPEAKALTDKNSRIYCRQDTWAMVEVAYFLAQRPRPARPVGM